MSVGTGSATGQSNVSLHGGYVGTSTGHATGESVVAIRSTIIETYDSQLSGQMLVQATPWSEQSQMAMLVAGSQRAEGIDNAEMPLLALTQIDADDEYLYQLPMLVMGAADVTDTNVSEMAMLMLVRSNPDRRKLRAWSFVEDGHWFYVLHLGNIGTLVFDTVTRKWSEWQTNNMNNWRAGYGVNWQVDCVAGGVDNNIIYNVSGSEGTDDGLPIISRITGGYPMRMRGTLTVDEVMITSSVGVSSVVSAGTMQLRGSDDYGVTWQDYGTLALNAATPKTQVSWRSLGVITMPGRIFEIIDTGAAKRINSLEMFTRDENNGG